MSARWAANRVRGLLAARADREAVTPWDLFAFMVAGGAGLVVVAIGALLAWIALQVAADLIQKWTGK
jgi:hypothetical protein